MKTKWQVYKELELIPDSGVLKFRLSIIKMGTDERNDH
jgi:hypothetical protein